MQKISITNEPLLAIGMAKKDVSCLGKSVKYFSRYGNWEDIKKRRASLVVPPTPRLRISSVSTRSSDSSNSAKTGSDRRNGRLGDMEFIDEGEYLKTLQQNDKRRKKGVKGKSKQASNNLPKISNSKQQQHNKNKQTLETRDTLDEKLQGLRTVEAKVDNAAENKENDDQILKYGIDWRRDPGFDLEFTRPYTFSYLPALPYHRKPTSEGRKSKRAVKMRHTSRQQAPPVHKH